MIFGLIRLSMSGGKMRSISQPRSRVSKTSRVSYGPYGHKILVNDDFTRTHTARSAVL
eukprot:SAG31_NODE_47_length_30979_cov_41.708841_32_plen_58_part_00